MAAYVIYQGEVLDPDRYEVYKAAAAPNIVASGGRYIVRGAEIHVLDGDPPASRTVILEFDDVAAARACYESDAYQEIRKLREGVAEASLYIVEGLS